MSNLKIICHINQSPLLIDYKWKKLINVHAPEPN